MKTFYELKYALLNKSSIETKTLLKNLGCNDGKLYLVNENTYSSYLVNATVHITEIDDTLEELDYDTIIIVIDITSIKEDILNLYKTVNKIKKIIYNTKDSTSDEIVYGDIAILINDKDNILNDKVYTDISNLYDMINL
jgi:hypothetical protein